MPTVHTKAWVSERVKKISTIVKGIVLISHNQMTKKKAHRC